MYIWLFQVHLCEGAESYEIGRCDNTSFSFCRGFFAQDRGTEMKKKCEACPWESNVAHKELAASFSRLLDSWQTSCSSTCCINILLTQVVWAIWFEACRVCFASLGPCRACSQPWNPRSKASLICNRLECCFITVDVDEGLRVFSQSESVLVSPMIEFPSIVV